jgi:hypothetical protein
MAQECSDPPRGWRRLLYVSHGWQLEGFYLWAEYCCCCIGSDGEGPSRRYAETSGGRQDRGSYARGEKGAGSAKAAASGGSKPVPAAKPAAPRHGKASASVKAAASGGSKPPLGGLVKGRRPLSPARRIADFGTDISVDDYLVGKLKLFFCFLFLLDEVFNQYHGAGSSEGQLAVVPPPVVTTSPTAVVGAKGASWDPWATFCTSGEILSAAAAKDVAGSMSQRLREASHQLSQQLKQVSCVGLRCLLFL